MSKFWSGLAHLPARLFAFVEDNLPFLLMLASGWHFVQVLRSYDNMAVAVAIGLLVDVGTFHAIRLAARYRFGVDRAGRHYGRASQFALRWSVALVMTALSLYYHLAYYEPAVLVARFLLAIPLPLLIVAVSYFRAVDKQEPVAEKGANAGRNENEGALHTETKPAAVTTVQTIASHELAFRKWQERPESTLQELAIVGGCSLSTASRWRKEWQGNGNDGNHGKEAHDA